MEEYPYNRYLLSFSIFVKILNFSIRLSDLNKVSGYGHLSNTKDIAYNYLKMIQCLPEIARLFAF